MKKYLTIFMFFIFCGLKVEALEIVYPKTNPVNINAPSTFFIGSADITETVKINDSDVKLFPVSETKGAFAQIVPLNYGENNFKIDSNNETVNFKINRAQPLQELEKPQTIIEYPMMNFHVKSENAPLRTTPVDGGINRLSQLPQDTKLFINGEQNGFYRVYLNSCTFGWIKKSDVEQDIQTDYKSAQINEFKMKEEKHFCIYEFNLSDKSPFVLKEENGLTLYVFNIKDCESNTYCINIPMQKLMGYDIFYEDNKLILKIRKSQEIDIQKPLKKIVIAVDAGHGGNENGAIGACGDKEKDINLAIAKNLQQELECRGAKAVMTREKDVTVSLPDRVNFAKDNESVILISIHANALPDGKDPNKNKGTSVYYYHNQAKPLAENILNSMTTQLCTQNDKVRQGSLALVRPTSSVSVLIEVAYIINPEDYALLLNKDFQINCAKSIADGIEKYLLSP